jgi:hypothetical protein
VLVIVIFTLSKAAPPSKTRRNGSFFRAAVDEHSERAAGQHAVDGKAHEPQGPQLAGGGASKELAAVRVPDLAEEATSNPVRACEDARGDLVRCRHRPSKLLLRRGISWEQRA